MSEQKDSPKTKPANESSSELRPEELEGVSGGISTPGPAPVREEDDVKIRVR